MSDHVVIWNGTLARQDERRYSLLGDYGMIRRSMLLDAAPGKHQMPTSKELAGAKSEPAGSWPQIDQQRVTAGRSRGRPVTSGALTSQKYKGHACRKCRVKWRAKGCGGKCMACWRRAA